MGTIGRNVLVVACILGLAPSPFSSRLNADELDDVAVILGGTGERVRKWQRAPQIVVFTQGEFDRESLRGVVEFIELNTSLELPPESIFSFSSEEIDAISAGVAFSYNPAAADIGGSGVEFYTANRQIASGDIFIFWLERPYAAYFSVLTGTSGTLPNLSRGFAEGKENCFFHMRSKTGAIFASLIFINSRFDPTSAKACLYEELVQSMGLVADAEGSKYFTFNNQVGQKSPNRDDAILRALYDKRVNPGDPVQSVLDLYIPLLK